MTFEKYNGLFEEILQADQPKAPYDNLDFFHYTELNQKRQDRWLKKGEILPELADKIKSINTPQNWVLISEPWCGDASHIVPFIGKIAELNSKINLQIQLRDSDSEIDKYLTNGGKSIPILIVRDVDNKDIFHWGPRPEEAQKIHLENLNSSKTPEEKKIELQKWYNSDKGMSLQKELLAKF
jgi:hypothetical protein